MEPKNLQKGTVILFAVLLVTVVLTISLGVFNIVYRQILLSSMAKESEIAFTVADSARNCAQFWDSPERDQNTERPFGYFTPDHAKVETRTAQSVNCVGSGKTWEVDGDCSGGPVCNTSFYMVFPIEGRSARAFVNVVKDADPLSSPTTIRVDGYNMSSVDFDDATGQDCRPSNVNRAVQRTIETVTAG